jgi:hypothetical protein
MNILAGAVALIAAVALAAPAEAAKKRKKEFRRAPVSTVHSYPSPRQYDVYVSGEYIGRDPDPNIRSFMMRNPQIYDGPE